MAHEAARDLLQSYCEYQAAWQAELLRDDLDPQVLLELHEELLHFELLLDILGVER